MCSGPAADPSQGSTLRCRAVTVQASGPCAVAVLLPGIRGLLTWMLPSCPETYEDGCFTAASCCLEGKRESFHSLTHLGVEQVLQAVSVTRQGLLWLCVGHGRGLTAALVPGSQCSHPCIAPSIGKVVLAWQPHARMIRSPLGATGSSRHSLGGSVLAALLLRPKRWAEDEQGGGRRPQIAVGIKT